MKFIIDLPNGNTQSTSSKEEVVSVLKTNGVRGLNKRKPPARLNQKGTHEFVGSLSRTIKVSVI